MTSLMKNLITSLSSFADDFFAGLAQELLVIIVFFVSLFIWRHAEQRWRLPHGRPNSHPRKGSELASAKKGLSEELGGGAAGLRQRQAPSSRQRDAQPHVRVAEQRILQHLEHREFTRALNMYRALERGGRDKWFSEELFSAFIQSAIRVGKVDVVERMLRTMKRNGFRPTLTFWQTMLKMLSSRKYFGTCITAHSIFDKNVPVDKVAYSCLINAALEVGVPERAATLLEQYSYVNLEPQDRVLFLRTYVALGDADAAEVVFRKLGSQTTTLILNLLLLTCVNTKQPERALALLHDAHAVECDGGERIVDVVSYNTVLKGFVEAGLLSRCFDCLHAMLKRGIEPDDITFGTLLDICVADNDACAASEVVNLLVDRNGPMNAPMCTLFIKGLVRAHCLPRALELYDEMKRREAGRPDLFTYSLLIKTLVEKHDLERALCLVNDMTQAGMSPDDVILTHLLEGCRHLGNHALGKRLFADMVAAGVKPSEFTLVAVLKLHGRCGAHQEAHDLVACWEKEHGAKPTVIHYTCLMSGCLRTRNYGLAWAAYELMIENGVAPDATMISTLLVGMTAAQQFDRVLALARQALKAPTALIAPAQRLNDALAQMMAGGETRRQAEELRALMNEAGVLIKPQTSKRLV